MAQVNRKDVIADDVLQAPYELAKGFEAVILQLEKMISVGKQAGQSIPRTTSIPKVKKETEELTAVQKELDKVQKQITVTVAKNNEEYIKQQNILNQNKQALKERISLGEQDALVVNRQNSSLVKLEAALAKNVKAYSLLATEEARNSAEGKKLLSIITLQDAQSKELSATLGDNRKKVGDYTGSILKAWHEIDKLNKDTQALVVTQKNLAVITEQDREKYNQLSVAIQNNNLQINQYNKTINNARQSVAGFVSNIFGAVGLIGGIYGLVLAFKAFINVNKEFEKSLSDLAALTGASAEDLVFYKNAAIDLGAESKRAGKDVVEAFKLIGGAKADLLDNKEALVEVTKQALLLANAAGIEVPAAADALAGALNQLELPASEAARVVNTLAAAAQFGAAEIPDINAAYSEFGAVLRDANGSVEEGAALIETLAERQIKGAEAGTALRNVLLRLSAVNALPRKAQEQMAKFGVDIKKVADNSVPLAERLKELGKISGDATALVKVFGVENFVAGNIILNNIPKFEELTKKVTGTTSAIDQARIATDNFQGDLDSAGSEVSALATEIGGSVQGALRGLVQGFTTFVKVLRAIPDFLKENKALFIALGIAIVSFNTATIASTASLIYYAAAIKLMEIRQKSAILTTRAFYAVVAANPFGLILLAVSALIAALAIYDKNSERASKIAKESTALNHDLDLALKQVHETREKLNISIDDFLKKSPEEQKALREEILERKKQALGVLELIVAREEKIAQDARETTSIQNLKISLLSLAIGAEEAAKMYKDTADENASNAIAPFQERINALKLEIEEFDNFLKDSADASKHESEVASKAEQDGAYKLRKFRIEQAIKTQEEIQANEAKGYDDRFEAEKKAVELRIKLAEVERDHELASEKLSASDIVLINEQYQAKVLEINQNADKERTSLNNGRIEDERKFLEARLKSEIQINENIIALDKSSIEERNNASIEIADAKQQLLTANYEKEVEAAKGNATELLRLQFEYNVESEKLAKDLALGLNKNFFAIFDRDYGAQLEKSRQQTEALLTEAANAFNAGTSTAQQYASKRSQIERDSNNEQLKIAAEFLKTRLANFKGSEEDRIKIARELATVELTLAEDTANEGLRIAQARQEAIKNLESTAFSSASTIAANITAAKNQELDNQLKHLEEHYNQEVLLAGDNDARKKQLADKFAKEQKKLQDEKIKNDRKNAIFQKALAVTQVVVNVAEGITKAFAEFPYPVAVGLAALIGTTGALETAAILSAPIPSYAVGTESHKGGLARVGELGTELVVTPRGELAFTPNTSTVVDLEKGSKVYTHKETMKMLALGAISNNEHLGTREDSMLSNEILQTLNKTYNQIKNLQKDETVNYAAQHTTLHKVITKRSGNRIIIREHSMGGWLKP